MRFRRNALGRYESYGAKLARLNRRRIRYIGVASVTTLFAISVGYDVYTTLNNDTILNHSTSAGMVDIENASRIDQAIKSIICALSLSVAFWASVRVLENSREIAEVRRAGPPNSRERNRLSAGNVSDPQVKEMQ